MLGLVAVEVRKVHLVVLLLRAVGVVSGIVLELVAVGDVVWSVVASLRSSEGSCLQAPWAHRSAPSWLPIPESKHGEAQALSNGDVQLVQLRHQLALVELPWRHLAHDNGEAQGIGEQLD